MKRLSIAIPAGGGSEPVARCLRALAKLERRPEADVLVVAPNMAVAAAASNGREWVRIVEAESHDRYGRLRAAALAAARTSYVAMLAEDYTVDAVWLERALAAAESGADVVAGGTLAPVRAGLAARAAWLWEYSHLVPPLAGGDMDERQARLAPAGNVVYRREAVDPAWIAEADSELAYHAEMHRRGLRFRRDPAMLAVYHPPPFGRFVRERSRRSQMWAEPRAARLGKWGRRRAAAARLFLPPVLLARLMRRIAGKPRYWTLALAGAPLFARLALAEAVGEARAYLRAR